MFQGKGKTGGRQKGVHYGLLKIPGLWLGYGWLILMVAIIISLMVKFLGGATWYDYLGNISRLGIKAATLSLHPAEIVFLYLLYPGIFGLLVYYAVSRN